MDPADWLGHTRTLRIARFGRPGAFLALTEVDDGQPGASVLLPAAEVPPGSKVGAPLEVFLYLDSEGRPIATTRQPKVELGEVAFLKVTSCTEFGAFVDWGLPKELLVPFAEQTQPLRPGDRQPIGLYVDSSGRLAGTMRIAELLEERASDFELDEWVDGEAWRNDPEIGLFVIVERAFVGLVPKSEPHHLGRGQTARFRVRNLLVDGKMELSLRAHAHQEIEGDARKILEVLARPGSPRIGDGSPPEQIRQHFGLSKKAFKRAVGWLLKREAVAIDDTGFLVPGPRRSR